MARKKYDQEGSTEAPKDLGIQVAELFLRYMLKHGDVEDHRAATHLLGKMGKLPQACAPDEEKKARDEQALGEQAKIDEAAADSDDCLVDLRNDEVVLNKEEEYEEN